ncbi:hypothetical protein FGG08_005510 [Glutinoglossum americanum]|uniref:Uncharacterized protein n=1 Tax=Glutinoglossum americanum TaxID=1670608 RepID=A0A9P8HYB7_9PEZI|nr:hypothetical protein FGG08_005510 [Glutinoglossum americanum]
MLHACNRNDGGAGIGQVGHLLQFLAALTPLLNPTIFSRILHLLESQFEHRENPSKNLVGSLGMAVFLTQGDSFLVLLTCYLSLFLRLDTLTAAFVLVFAASCAKSRYRLREFKGPFLAKFTKLWVHRASRSGRFHLELWETYEKYAENGSLVRIGPNELLTNNPDVFRRINGARSSYRRSDWYDSVRVDPSIDHVFSERDITKHANLRAQLTAGFAKYASKLKTSQYYQPKGNPEFEQNIDKSVAGLVNRIETSYLSQGSTLRPFDFGRISHFFAEPHANWSPGLPAQRAKNIKLRRKLAEFIFRTWRNQLYTIRIKLSPVLNLHGGHEVGSEGGFDGVAPLREFLVLISGRGRRVRENVIGRGYNYGNQQ